MVMPDPAPDPDPFERLWLVGCGAMGGALLDRWLQCGLSHRAVTVIDPEPSGLPAGFGGHVAANMVTAARTSAEPTAVMLAIKPQSLAAVAAELQPWLLSPPLMLSMLAGVRTSTLAQLFPATRLVRIMPNMPARIGRGVTALYGACLLYTSPSPRDRG
jgi:pyrroline-5-carboxylate reductase